MAEPFMTAPTLEAAYAMSLLNKDARVHFPGGAFVFVDELPINARNSGQSTPITTDAI